MEEENKAPVQEPQEEQQDQPVQEPQEEQQAQPDEEPQEDEQEQQQLKAIENRLEKLEAIIAELTKVDETPEHEEESTEAVDPSVVQDVDEIDKKLFG